GACAVGTSMSINITPTTPEPVITGNDILCVGNSTTMIANPGGGTWNSSNTGVATIDAVTGVVTGVSNGSTTITYTYTDGCGTTNASQNITIGTATSTPTITGPGDVCMDNTINLIGTPTGGWWNSSDVSVATVDASGTLIGVSPG